MSESGLAQLGRGNPAAAEIDSRITLQRGNSDWREALAVRAIIAASLGYWSYAERFVIAQRAGTPSEARESLEKSVVVTRRRRAKGRFLIARAWGCGLWSDINHVLGCALLAEITGRKLIVHWGSDSLYNNNQSDIFSLFFVGRPLSLFLEEYLFPYNGPERSGAFPFRQVLVRTPSLIEMLKASDEIIISDRYVGVVDVIAWSPDCLWPDKAKTAACYYRLAARYLKLQPFVKSAVKEFIATHFSGRPYVAIHIRGTDKRNDVTDLDAVNLKLIDLLRTIDPKMAIFAMTDDAYALSYIQSLYPGRVISTNSVRSLDGMPVHTPRSAQSSVLGKLDLTSHSLTPATSLGLEVLIDTYIALSAEMFIGNGQSNVSASISLLKKWPRDKCILLSGNQLLEAIDWKISI